MDDGSAAGDGAVNCISPILLSAFCLHVKLYFICISVIFFPDDRARLNNR